MKIELINRPDLNPCVLAAWQCVHDGLDDVDMASKKNLISAVKQGHLSVLRHANIVFRITDVSRSLTHQLVRHSLSNFSQSSQRYTKIKDADWYIIPESIKANEEAFRLYHSHMIDVYYIYSELLRMGINKEDARYVMPNATKTALVYSGNLEAFILMLQARLCNHAQWEISNMAFEMRSMIKRYLTIEYGNLVAMEIYKHMRPKCNSCTQDNKCVEVAR